MFYILDELRIREKTTKEVTHKNIQKFVNYHNENNKIDSLIFIYSCHGLKGSIVTQDLKKISN